MADGDAVVVGAGPNGLAAAVAMARQGFRVTVQEAAGRIGGGTRSEELTLPGFVHDVCSAVHPMGAGSPFFRELPLAEHGLEWIQPTVPMAHPFDDGTAAVLHRSTTATAASLEAGGAGDGAGEGAGGGAGDGAEDGVGDGAAYRSMMDPFVARWEELFADAMAPPIRWPDHPLLMARLGLLGLRSATGLARRRFRGGRARSFFVGIAAHTLMRLDRPPTAAFGIMLALGGHGPGWPVPRGGSQSIADALAGVLRGLGGEIVTDSRVRSLDELPDADATFLDLTPRQVLDVAGPRLPAGYRRQLARYRYAPGVFKVDWALSEPIPWTAEACRRAGTVHIGPTMADIVRSADASWYGRDDEAPYVLLAQPSLFDSSRAPSGRHTAWAYCHVPHGSTRDMTAVMEGQVERFAPGFRDVVLARHTMDTADLEARNPNLVGGDINGGVQDVAQFVFRPARRIDPYRTPVEGLYLCSASTPPGGGVHGMCGYHAARSALGRLR